MRVVDVDGCKAGWVAACWNTRTNTVELAVHGDFASVISAYPMAKAIGVDMPIGLVDCRRACDREARAVLRCRKSSVFPAPDRRLLDTTEYSTANALKRQLCGRGLSVQSFALLRKVAEVDRSMTPELQARIVEVHPEISFWAMGNGEEVSAPKRTDDGYRIRLERLRSHLDLEAPSWISIESGIPGASRDDVLDAVAGAWTARR